MHNQVLTTVNMLVHVLPDCSLCTHILMDPFLLYRSGTIRADFLGAGYFQFPCAFLRKGGDFSSSACHSPTPCFPHDTRCFAELYWTAPELLRLPKAPWSGTPKGDVYSFAILMTELIHHQDHGPFDDINQMPDGKAERVFLAGFGHRA